jgi:5,10-methylenetetrahydromethanopterin reductase
VPIDIASSGPKVIAFAARTAERVTFAIGADPERMAWAVDLARTAMAEAGRAPDDVSFGAYVSVGCHPDKQVGAELIRGAEVRTLPGVGHLMFDESREAVDAVGSFVGEGLTV